MRAVMLLPVGTEAPAVALCPMQVCAAPRTSVLTTRPTEKIRSQSCQLRCEL
jgi:hypothetical protein